MQQRSHPEGQIGEPDVQTRTAPHAVAVVDIDQIIKTDVLIETTLQLLRRDPIAAVLLPYWLWLWLTAGRARLQHEIALRQPIEPSALPYEPTALLDLVRLRADGARISLATTLDQTWADAIASHLGLTEPVVASGPDVIATGLTRQARLDAMFGPGAWRMVALGHESRSHGSLPPGDRLLPYWKALRPHQWLKNLLVLVPIALAHLVLDPRALFQGLVAVAAFSLTASSVYVLNDLVDLSEDRRHPRKQRRPFASGAVPLWHGLVLAPMLLALAVALSLLALPRPFVTVLLAYYAATLAYSFVLKRTMLFDVITLAGLYTLRIVAGSAAVDIPRSFWLLAFSVFLFFSLALVKRYVEIRDTIEAHPTQNGKLGGRGYRAVDLETLSQFGIASGMMAVLVLALYIDSAVVKSLYRTPELIWLLCPIMLYLICRFWILARRGEMHDDPIVFAARDWRSQIVVAAGGLLLVMAALV